MSTSSQANLQTCTPGQRSGSTSERGIRFSSGGNELFGILTLAGSGTETPPPLGVVFVHGGVRGRLGLGYQYPYYARRLAKLGIPSFRFDPHGMGDSTGRIEPAPMEDFYASIQLGRYVGDTVAATEEFCRQVNPKRLVFFGLCGGAITALLAATEAPRKVDDLVLLSIPVLVDGSDVDPFALVESGYARHYLVSAYAGKLLSPSGWMRLLAGRSDLRLIWGYSRILASALTSRLIRRKPAGSNGASSQPPHPRFNPHFLPALEALIARQSRLLFLLGRPDLLSWNFERYFYDVYWRKHPACQRQCEVHFLADCNHLFTLREWQARAVDLTMAFLTGS